MWPGAEVVYTLRTTNTLEEGIVTPWDLTNRTNHICVESDMTILSSAIRFPHGIIEFLGRIHKKHVKALVDSRSTGNYISDKIGRAFGLQMK